MKGLKRKLAACQEEEARLYQQSQSRIKHLGDLYGMQSLDDVKYEQWSRTRLDRLLVDYMLRQGYKDSALGLSQEKGIEDIVDVETFVQMSRIRESLRSGKVNEALAWCNENKKDLRKMDVSSLCILEVVKVLTIDRASSNLCYGYSNTSNWSAAATKANSSRP
jgi:macrophage erythroblast attacher